jgi:hypothetical protein
MQLPMLALVPLLTNLLSDNVDYNDIKQLIKERTTKDKVQAISIPGQEHRDPIQAEFERQLYTILAEQHQRIDDFVSCKSGEIHRRLSWFSLSVTMTCVILIFLHR